MARAKHATFSLRSIAFKNCLLTNFLMCFGSGDECSERVYVCIWAHTDTIVVMNSMTISQ